LAQGPLPYGLHALVLGAPLASATLLSVLRLLLSMGNSVPANCTPGNCTDEGTCQSGAEYLESLADDTGAKPARPGPLRTEERRWLPESLYRTRLLLGLAPDVSVDGVPEAMPSAEDCWLLVLGAGGQVLAVLAQGGLERYCGVRMEPHDGREAFALRLHQLGSEVHGVLLVADRAVAAPVGLLSEAAGQEAKRTPGRWPAARTLCWLHLPEVEPPKSGDAGLGRVVLALHSGLNHGRPWDVEAVGRRIPTRPGGLFIAANPLAAELSARAVRFFTGGHGWPEPLPEAALADPVFRRMSDEVEIQVMDELEEEEPEREKLSAALATENRCAGENGAALMKELRRVKELRERLAQARQQLPGAHTKWESLQCPLEVWRRDALLAKQRGEVKEVEELLSRFPIGEPKMPGEDATEAPGKDAPQAPETGPPAQSAPAAGAAAPSADAAGPRASSARPGDAEALPG